YLDELLRHDALGVHNQPLVCPNCSIRDGAIKCIDCNSATLLCPCCTVNSHTHLVLHRIQRWNGTYFEDETLQNIGLQIQLGHDGQDCPAPAPLTKSTDFEVIDTSGQHTVTISFCGCPGFGVSHYHPRIQLLRMQWLPATTDRPNTAFTFDVLNTFQLLSLQGKLSAYDFYQSLVHKTDNLGI
ncbi:hypothetical protein FIBSPDRAFT_717468, partial [Athelia psychrophila]